MRTDTITYHRRRSNVWGRRMLAAVAVVLSAAILAQAAPAAKAAIIHQVEQSWTLPGEPALPPTLSNGAGSPLYVWVNTNDTAGAAGTASNVTFTTTITNGTITRLPAECSGTGSRITATPNNTSNSTRITSVLTCNVGQMPTGSAKRVTVPVVAHGYNGTTLRAATTVAGVNAAALTRTITATVGGNIRMNHTAPARTVERTSRVTIPIPVAVDVPAGAEGLAPSGSFVLTLGNYPVNAGLAPSGCDASGVASSVSWPAAQPIDNNISCTFSPYGTGGNQWRVNFTGFNTDPAQAQTRSNTGALLPSSRVHLATFNVLLRNSHDMFTESSSTFAFFARADSATLMTSRGVSVADTPSTDNRTEITYVLGASRAAGWSRKTPSQMSFDGRAVGTEWDNNARPIPGQTWLPYVFDSTNSATRAGAGQPLQVCLVLQSTHYSPHGNYVYFNTPTGTAAGAEATIEYATAPVYNTGIGTANCDHPGLQWTQARYAPQGANAAGIGAELGATLPPSGTWNAWALNHLRWIHGSTPSATGPTPTYVRLSYTGAAVRQGNPYAELDNISYLAMPVRVDTTTPGTRAWMTGATKRHNETGYYVSNQAPTIRTIGGAAPTTITSMRDVLTVGDWHVTAQMSSNRPVADAGEEVTFTIRVGAQGRTGTRIVDTSTLLPAGFAYVNGSATGQTPSLSTSGGRRLLTWNNVSIPTSGQRTLTFKAVSDTTGNFTHQVTAVKDGQSASSMIQGAVASATTAVAIQDSGSTVLEKEAAGEYLLPAASSQWRIRVSNDDSHTQPVTDVIDVLPWNGDGRGSSFVGGNSVGGNVSANQSGYRVGDVTASGGAVIYYTTTAPGQISADPADASNGAVGVPSARWTTTKPADTRIRAVRVIATGQRPGQTLHISIPFTPTDYTAANRYVNWAAARATHTSLQMVRSAETYIREREPGVYLDKELVAGQELIPGQRVYYDITMFNDTDRTLLYPEVWDRPVQNLAWNVSGTDTAAAMVASAQSLLPGRSLKARVGLFMLGEGTDLQNLAWVQEPLEYANLSCTPTNVQVNDGVSTDTDQCDMETTELTHLLQVNKAVTVKDVVPGGYVSFTVEARNEGPATASGVTVTDVPLAGFDDVTFSGLSKGSAAGWVWSVGDLNPGEVATATATARIGAGADVSSGVVNAATIASPARPRTVPASVDDCVANTDAVMSDLDQCDWESVTEDSHLQVDKHVIGNDGLVAGSRVTFEVTVRNAGADTASRVEVRDSVLEGLTDAVFESASTGQLSGQVWQVGDLPAGAAATATVSASVTQAAALLRNVVTVSNPSNPREVPASVDECGPNSAVDADDWSRDVESDDDQCDWVEVFERSLLRVDKSAGTFTHLGVDAEASWVVTVTNDGPDTAADVTVTDTPLVGLRTAEFTDASTGSAAGPVWHVGDLPAGASATATVTAHVSADADPVTGLVNSVTVSNITHPREAAGSVNDCVANPTVADDTDQCDYSTLVEDSSLQVSKTVTGQEPLLPGNRVEFTVVARNSGATGAAGVVVTDAALVGFSDAVFTDPQVGTVDGNVWLLGSLLPDAPVTATVTATIAEGGSVQAGLVNAAAISNASNPRTVPASVDECVSNSGDVTTDTDQCDIADVVEDTVLRIVKTARPGEALPGGTITWDITVGNDGPHAATGVEVIDQPVTGLSDAVFTDPSRGAVTDGRWLVGMLPAGAEASVTVTTRVDDAAVHGQVLTNRAVVQTSHTPRTSTGCVANTDLGGDTDQCDEADVTAVERGGVEVEVLFRPAGQQSCDLGGCKPLQGVGVTNTVSGDAITDASGLVPATQLLAGDRVTVGIVVPDWGRLEEVFVDGNPAGVEELVDVTATARQVRRVTYVVSATTGVRTPPAPGTVEFESGI